jgi:hypothetical protein
LNRTKMLLCCRCNRPFLVSLAYKMPPKKCGRCLDFSTKKSDNFIPRGKDPVPHTERPREAPCKHCGKSLMVGSRGPIPSCCARCDKRREYERYRKETQCCTD